MNPGTKSKQNFTAWAIVAIVGLLALNTYQWFANSQLKNQNSVQSTNLADLENANAELEADYETALANLEEMRGDNKELNDLIDSQKKQLTEQKDKISNLIWTKRELTKAKDELSKMNASVTQYMAEISKLKDENAQLASANTDLTNSNQQLTTNLETEKTEKAEISQARAVLASEKEALSTKNEKLSTKVDMANAIKINFMDIKGFEVAKGGKIKEKTRSKNIDMIRTCFTTETNMVTPSGEKTFYIRIINPQGETVAIENSGSGVITNKLDNTQVRYTTSGKVDYQNKDTNACIDWMLENKLPDGNYKAEIYNNGFMVGQGSFRLK